jgi:hypothetical protein
MTAWLDENCGADGWVMTPSGRRGVLNDAVSIYFPDAALAGAFVARWCIGYYKVETAKGTFRVREDEPTTGRDWVAPDAVRPSGFGAAPGGCVPRSHLCPATRIPAAA